MKKKGYVSECIQSTILLHTSAKRIYHLQGKPQDSFVYLYQINKSMLRSR
jgi:hypothetical protein